MFNSNVHRKSSRAFVLLLMSNESIQSGFWEAIRKIHELHAAHADMALSMVCSPALWRDQLPIIASREPAFFMRQTWARHCLLTRQSGVARVSVDSTNGPPSGGLGAATCISGTLAWCQASPPVPSHRLRLPQACDRQSKRRNKAWGPRVLWFGITSCISCRLWWATPICWIAELSCICASLPFAFARSLATLSFSVPLCRWIWACFLVKSLKAPRACFASFYCCSWRRTESMSTGWIATTSKRCKNRTGPTLRVAISQSSDNFTSSTQKRLSPRQVKAPRSLFSQAKVNRAPSGTCSLGKRDRLTITASIGFSGSCKQQPHSALPLIWAQ